MQSKAKGPTKDEKARMERIVSLGCVACRSNEPDVILHPSEVHHLTDCGRRRGHRYTVCLCTWHHRGMPTTPDWTVKRMTEQFGPSLYHDGKAFKARYGGDESLLSFTEYLLTLDVVH